MKRALWLLTAALASLPAPPAAATWTPEVTPFSTGGAAPELSVPLSFRSRGDMHYNLDLDRGPTPSGALLYPAPASDPEHDQLLLGADMRLRLLPRAVYRGVAVHAQVDVLDNLAFGSTPEPAPSSIAVSGQDAPRFGLNSLSDAVAVRRVWAEILTPIGVLNIGRMPVHWGLGMLFNDGLGPEANGGTTVDGVSFATPLFGHLWAAGAEVGASGPVLLYNGQPQDRTPADDVRGVSLSVLRMTPSEAWPILLPAGRLILDYGLHGAHRWQTLEAMSLPDGSGLLWDERGLTAGVVDAWLRLLWQGLRVEVEAAAMYANVDNASLMPGVKLNRTSLSRQWGGAVQTEWVQPGSFWRAGLDVGVASGDPAPGFGVRNDLGTGQPGDLDGWQVRPPYDLAADNLRFHPDFFVDRVLWRRLVGTFTDGVFVKAHGAITPWRGLSLELAGVASAALEATSAPGRRNLLGVELDPALRYRSDDGFELLAAYGFLWPLAGLANNSLGLDPRPGQVVRLMARVEL